MAYVIGVDCGTSGTKTVLFREDGTVMASATIEYPMYQPKNGYAEQDPADWKDAMIRTIQTVVTKSGVSKEEIKGIGISGQMHGLVMLDKDNNILRKSIIWCDQRTAAEVDEMNRVVGREKLMEITANPALTGWTAAKILWVRNNEPVVYEKCRHILLPKDYRYTNGQLIEQLLTAWSGGALDVIRVSNSTPVHIERPCINIIGTAQTNHLCRIQVL